MIVYSESQYVGPLGHPATRAAVTQLVAQRAMLPNLCVFAAINLLFLAGVWDLAAGSLLQSAIAVPLLSVAMILAWYLGHDCAHSIVFENRKWNYRLGSYLAWINGFAYFRFRDYSHDHIRHHAQKVDLLGTDVNQLLASFPGWIRRLVLRLEHSYFPVLHYLIKIDGAIAILRADDKWYRMRVLAMAALSAGFLALITLKHWFALPLYFAAQGIRIHCTRFVDAFQHSYIEADPADHTAPGDKLYEHKNTFSFPVAYRHRWLNLLILNFGFHNAHHSMPSCPWYHLPRLDTLLTSHDCGAPQDLANVTMRNLLAAYHRHRKVRVTASDEGQPYDAGGRFSLEKFTGAFTDKLLG
ncbi:fatty acid desaturase family protein [Paraherbaspirillum soli]|uniref:Fatty acid desaturase family protein n=1 Tax=Paraherbaspirillum soli TaxID=631222 RepID=A0ABW0MB98_9BURK